MTDSAKQSKKKATSSDEKFQNQDFDLFKAIEAIDRKDYDWFDNLTDEQKKKFVPYMMLHWISAVQGNRQVSSYYLLSLEHYGNKHCFNEKIYDHPELQWLMLCASSPGIGKQYHQWIPHLNSKIGSLKERASFKEVLDYFSKIYSGDNALLKQLATEFVSYQNHAYKLGQIYHDMKLSDLETLAKIVSKEEVAEYERDSGLIE